MAGFARFRLAAKVRYCTTRVSPFRFVKSTYTRWFRSKCGANAIESSALFLSLRRHVP